MTSLLSLSLLFVGTLFAQDITTIEAKDGDISDNLDLEAVASLFGECADLEEFERRLNDPDTRLSNLDLNEDGYVDYLRVVENAESEYHLITIQAVVGQDLYQDVATIDVEKDDSNETRVQIVGDVYMYGPNYIIEPVYVSRPRIYLSFWGPRYVRWASPWYWNYYPSYWHWWSPFPVYTYMNYIHGHIHHQNVYHRRNVRRSAGCAALHRTHRRNAMEVNRPETSFRERNKGVINREDLLQQREAGKIAKPRPSKEVSKEWQTEAEKQGRDSKVKEGRVKVPQDKPSTQTRDTDNRSPKSPEVTRDKPAKDRTSKPRNERKPKKTKAPKTSKTPKSPKSPKAPKTKKQRDKSPSPQKSKSPSTKRSSSKSNSGKSSSRGSSSSSSKSSSSRNSKSGGGRK